MSENTKSKMTEKKEQRKRLEQQIRFIIEADKVKSVFRQTYLADGSRKENDAEHSWHLALSAILLKEHMDAPVDLMKVIVMVLIHDLVEIDAGDTYAYDSEGAKSKRERELKAAERISVFFQKIRERISEVCGMNLKNIVQRMQNSLICSIISSRFY